MQKPKKIGFITTIFAIVLSFSFSLTAVAATLDVNRVKQAKTNWCWAATSEMIGTYVNSSSSITQWDIVSYLKGSSYPNEGGTVSNIKDGIKYASSNTVTYTSGSTLSWSNHTSNIDKGYPIAIWMAWNGGSAHALVCAGTKTTSGSNYLYVVDPWENNTSEWYKYDSLKNGTTIQSGTGKYTTSFWKN